MVLYIAGRAVGDWLFPRRPVANSSPCLPGPTFFPAPLNAYPVPPSVGTCSWRQLASRLVCSINGKLQVVHARIGHKHFCVRVGELHGGKHAPVSPFFLAGACASWLRQQAQTSNARETWTSAKPWRISEDLQRGVALSGVSTRKSRFLSFRRLLLPPRRAPLWHSIMTVRTSDTAQERGEVARARPWSRQARPSRTLGPGANSIALPASCWVSLLRAANPQP